MSPFIVIFTEGVSLCKSLSSCYLYFLNLSVGCNGYSGWEYTELTNKSNLYVHLETNWMSHTKSPRPLDVFSCHIRVKVGLSPSKKKCFICFSGSTSKITTHILLNISRIKGNQTIKFGQLIEHPKRNIFLEKLCSKWGRETSSRSLFVF